MKTLTCGKCNGTGWYLDLGGCYACNGTGRISVTAKEYARIEHAKANREIIASAQRVARQGVAAAREWIRAHRDNEIAINAIWAALHDEGYTAEGNAVYAWAKGRTFTARAVYA